MFLHYLGKHQDEPQKLCIFSHAAYCVEYDTALACCIFDMHQLLLTVRHIWARQQFVRWPHAHVDSNNHSGTKVFCVAIAAHSLKW